MCGFYGDNYLYSQDWLVTHTRNRAGPTLGPLSWRSTGSAVATTMYQYMSESPRVMGQHTQLAPASSSGAGAAQSGAPPFWYNAVDAAALSAASTGEMEYQVRHTTEAQGTKAPITSAHLGMQVGSFNLLYPAPTIAG